MKQFSKDLGNVSLAPKGKWSREQEYERLALVYNACDNFSYISKINVPSGVDIENRIDQLYFTSKRFAYVSRLINHGMRERGVNLK